jgi:hypothetical protein
MERERDLENNERGPGAYPAVQAELELIRAELSKRGVD